MSMEQFSSALAPAIRDLILFKRECGAVYKHGEVLLGQFDQFCRNTEYEGTVLTEDLVMRWKQHNEYRKHRQKSQMLTYVRHLGQFLATQGKDTYVPPMEHRSGTSDPIVLSSVFAPFIDAFITQKRADGYDYKHGERILYRFDRYCTEIGIQEPKLTCELVYDWVATTSSRCLYCFDQFAKYMRSIGIEAYTPQRHPSHFQQQPYILSEAELSAFFTQVDSFCPDYRSCERMAAGYSIMFRLYYRFVFADTKTQWTYRIDAVLGTVLEKQQKEIVTTDFISLEEAKEIALKDAGLNEATQKIVFTREELSRNSGKPCYILEFYTAKKQYSYKVDAKNGSIIEAYHFILLADAKKIALDDAGVNVKVVFTTEELVAGGIKSPYYYFVFESDSARWTYKIDAVLGVIMDKTCDKIIPLAPEFIGLEKAKQIALEDAGLDEATQKIVFTREGLSRNQGKPYYILEFYTDKCAYSYKVDAVSGDILEKKIEWRSLQESEPVSETVQSSDSNQRRIG